MNNSDTALMIRRATVDDAPALWRLAALDSAPALEGEALLALDGGEPVAALDLDDGRVVANPFRPTEGTVALLRLRAQHLAAPAPRRRRRPALLRPRAA
jgi:hypothetical protein